MDTPPLTAPDTTRVPLAQITVAGTQLERSLERIVAAAKRPAVAAFSSSI